MDQARWEKIDHIIDVALRFTDAEAQEAFIKSASDGNRQLYRDVKDLLTSIRKAKESNFLEH